MSSALLSSDARRALAALAKGQVSLRFPDFWQLTEGGIVRRTLPPGFRSASEIGFRRTPRFRVYNPLTGEALQRIKLWIAKDVTEEQADRWIDPYRARPPLKLFEVTPTMYELARPRKRVFEWKIEPALMGHLDEVAVKMNKLAYRGMWRVRTLVQTGERVLVIERGVRPTIVLKPKAGTFHGLEEQEFDVPQVEQSAAIILQMLADNTKFASYSRSSESLSQADVQRLSEQEQD